MAKIYSRMIDYDFSDDDWFNFEDIIES
jgi:hypothetical protein